MPKTTLTKWLLMIIPLLVGFATPAEATFSETLLQEIRNLHRAVVLEGTRTLTATDAQKVWELFDQEVRQALKQSNPTQLKDTFPWTDIVVTRQADPERPPLKTGAIEIRWFRLTPRARSQPDERGSGLASPSESGGLGEKLAERFPQDDDSWLTLYYQGLGVLPASTFRIWQRAGDQYQLAAQPAAGPWDPAVPSLPWFTTEIELLTEAGSFKTRLTPATTGGSTEMQERIWSWDGKDLRLKQ